MKLAAAVLLAGCISLLTTPLSAQTAGEWLERGHRAADAGQHMEAIAAYEEAIRMDPAIRPRLVARLGRQYLWAGRPAVAATLLHEYLQHSDECDVRNDYGLALSWSDQLRTARKTLENVVRSCPGEDMTARLRLAAVHRWLDRPSAAEALYEHVLLHGSAPEQAAAQLGLAHVALLRDDNRLALSRFSVAMARESAAHEAALGAAVAEFRLGGVTRADELLERLERAGYTNRELTDLSHSIAFARAPHVSSNMQRLQDADGTALTHVQLGASAPVSDRSRLGGNIGFRRLVGAAVPYDALSFDVVGEHRRSRTLGARVTAGQTHWDSRDWRPVTYEVHGVITPTDRLRGDVAVARILIADNVEAVTNRLSGNFASAGADLRLRHQLTLSAALDATAWSAGNTRLRMRGTAQWQFEGVPRLTLELPVLVQLYDQPFPFPLFSPDRYIEAGPAANVYMRVNRHWNLSGYARIGAQKESGQPAQPLGTVRLTTWRDPAAGWGVELGLGWSNSNLASSSSFRRTTFALGARAAL